MNTWQQSKYGSQLKFCESATLADVRKMWELYSVQHKAADASHFAHRFEDLLPQAENKQDERGVGSTTVVLTGFHSAVPVHIGALGDLDALHKHHWEHGNDDFNANVRASAKHYNPTFLTLEDEAIIHYGTDLLLGFHLATAYAPLNPDNPLFYQIKDLHPLERVVTVARMEFREWMASYKEHATSIKVRFLIANAASFAHTSQHRRMTDTKTAFWYRDQHHLKPLILDGPDYLSGIAPLVFNVIDTSNLWDHFGSLILLTATSPLLRTSYRLFSMQMFLMKHHKATI